MLHQLLGQGKAVQERAEAAIVLCTQQGFSMYLAMGTILRGWALAEQGQGEEGIALMRQGLSDYKTTGAELARPSYLLLLAEGYQSIGQPEEGLDVLAEALTIAHKTGEHVHLAELYRLKGELLLAQKGKKQEPVLSLGERAKGNNEEASEAEACFHKAIDIARHQGAKSLELRAVMSLSQLRQSQGKKAEARRILAKVFSWFTEGFDTPDLQAAKALLEQLSERPIGHSETEG
jgi:predicted ATPase